MSERVVGPTPAQVGVRRVLVVGYVALIVLGFLVPWQPRLFWTMLLPILVVAIVLMGFANWREICPLAAFGAIGQRLNRGEQRRVPDWMERWFFVVTFGVLAAMLALRLVATNGDGLWVAALLLGLAVAAAVTNSIFTGKTWCNFVCPVGMVERIYTEPGSLLPGRHNSQCVRCTACKKYCPDIDQENAYWRDVTSSGRRVAMFAFPGLVLAFYTYFWLRHGDWEAYFDGRWTRQTVDAELWLGPGFFFAPGIPAVAAATLTLVAFSAASYAVFSGVEALAGRWIADAERRRHLVLGVAAFAAFNLFYLFAGAPSLRRLPGGLRFAAFAAPLVATLFLVKRWRRRREHYIRDRSAAKLLRNWPFEEPPPDDPTEVYARLKAGEHAREEHLAAYTSTVREMIADGLVHSGEMRLLEEVRKNLGISSREHERILAQLSEEERELFERKPGSVERRAQLEGYETALSEALLRHAPEHEIEELRLAFGVDREAHQEIVDRLKSDSGPLLERARRQLDRAVALHGDIAALGTRTSAARSFLAYLLEKQQDAAVDRVTEFLEIAGDRERVGLVRQCLFSEEERTRKAALLRLKRACPDHVDWCDELEPVVMERESTGTDDRAVLAAIVARQAESSDPYVRAAAVWAAAKETAAAGGLIASALTDPDELVRETAVHAARFQLEMAEATLEGGEEGRERTAADLESLLASAADAEGESFAALAVIEKMQFLRKVPIFEDLDPEDLYDVALLALEESIAPPEPICREGEIGDDLFVLIEGRVEVVVRSGEGDAKREVRLGVMGEGEVIGELSLLDGSPRSATVRPLGSAVRVLRIPGTTFRSRLMHRPRVTRPLLTSMASHIRRLSRKAAGAE
ncbi:MAG: cyclic nucleotide-binding domain-containing protein [Thermoanaerobaculia bacterium]|nr:cyclic nucleotide-binding domain-containing protein [Thermoanaerobaculia bacterium]